MTNLEITRRDARRAALTGLIDYAGLFPPAALSMPDAAAGYRAARASDAAWIVDRFICPASRLEELVGVMSATMEAGEEPWPISVTAGPGWLDSLAADAGAVRTFTDTVGTAASVELVETKIPDEIASDPDRLAREAAEVLRAYQAVVTFEVSWDVDVAGAFGVLAGLRTDEGRALGVKIRCGGLEAPFFPPSLAVARFIREAVHAGLPFKATAGLHHPFRHTDPDTGFTHHGFVNLLIASGLAHLGATVDSLVEVLEDRDAGSFELAKNGVVWRDRRIDHDALEATRQEFLAYGSCSFDEPVEDLTALGVLPA